MTIKVGPCGGDGGELRDMENIDDITSIVKISVYSSTDRIHAITIAYTYHDGVEESVTWGKPKGVLAEFTLGDSEYIKSVKGYYGRSNGEDWCGVRSLQFVTSWRSLGPYGNEAGTPFELPEINGKIIGFHGRSEDHLDALGVHIKVGDTGGSSGTA